MRLIPRLLCTALILVTTRCESWAAEYDIVKSAVPVVLESRLQIHTSAGAGDIPIRVSRNWDTPQADVTRAVILIHGWPRRDIDTAPYVKQHAGALAEHTIFVTPQFLIEADVEQHRLPAVTLRWSHSGWRNGANAQGPVAISSFAVMDTIFARLSDRAMFPHLKDIVLAGHSAGAQFVQRYAVVGRGEEATTAAGIHIRYVVANPATYLYFDDLRPQSDGSFAAADLNSCPGASAWNMGLASVLPPYVVQPVSAEALKSAYLKRDVIYLLGTADNDPKADALGTSCAAELQGATRYARGKAYYRYITAASEGQTPATHRKMEISGVSHHSFPLYTSSCGFTALFDQPGCAD